MKLKSFEVESSLLERIKADAVPERFARLHPDKPIISADPWPDQFGLPKSYFHQLTDSIIQGTGKNAK